MMRDAPDPTSHIQEEYPELLSCNITDSEFLELLSCNTTDAEEYPKSLSRNVKDSETGVTLL